MVNSNKPSASEYKISDYLKLEKKNLKYPTVWEADNTTFAHTLS